MLRRLVILLLFMVLPLQAFASVHMTLSAIRQQALASTVSSEHSLHAAHHAAQAVDTAGQHQHGTAASHGCTGCDICMPPLAFSLPWTVGDMSAVVVARPDFSSRGILPRTFDRPPKHLA